MPNVMPLVRCSGIHQMNQVSSRSDLWSWWQHYKYRPGILIIYYYYTAELTGTRNRSEYYNWSVL